MNGRVPELHDADLEALLQRRAARATLSGIDRERIVLAAISTTRLRGPVWQWPRVFVPLAAVFVIVVVAGSAILGTAQLPPSASPGTTTHGSLASGTAAPVSGGRVLTIDELKSVIDASHQDARDRVVIAEATVNRIDPRLAGMSPPICRQPPCGSTGVLEGVEPFQLVQLPRDVVAAIPTGPEPISGTLALVIHPPSSVVLLGVVNPVPSGPLTWPATASGTAPALQGDSAHVIAVEGWLQATPTNVIYDCAIASPLPLPDSPFERCAGLAWITGSPSRPSFDAGVPIDAIQVQPNAYFAFAPEPKIDSLYTPEPRLATYLLRVVTDTNCTTCRGWRIVGRVGDATSPPGQASPSPSVSPSPEVSPSAALGIRSLLYVELQQLLSNARADGQERTVLADMQIDVKPSQFQDRPDCGSGGGCLGGTMPDADGRLVPVFTSASERDSWGHPTDAVGGEFAIRVNGDATIDLLGFPWPAAAGNVWSAHASLLRGVPQDVLVDGWLTGTEFPCQPAPGSDQDTPFWTCADSWVTQAAIPSDALPSATMFSSVDGLPVQPSAYSTFAPDPVGNVITSSRHGVYLLRHVSSTASWCNPCDGWRVLGRMTEGGLPVAGFSPPPTEPPLEQPSILSEDDLRAAIASHKVAGALTTDVVADVPIDVSQRPEPIERECQDPIARCNVVGTLEGFGPDDGVVVLRNDEYYPDLTFRDGTGPVALRLSAGPIQYLGHVAVESDGRTWSSTDAQAAQDSISPGDVLAVKGWLESVQTISCGPAPQPGPPLLPPFGCAIKDAITPTPVQTTFPMSPNGSQTVEPSEGLLVQTAAYREFAPDPNQALPAVRFGVYLVERVQNLNANCFECHGWLVVGRLEPEGGSLIAENPRVFAPAELEAELAADRSSMVGRTVVVDGLVSPREPLCRGGDRCAMGTLAGTTEPVFATSATASFIAPGNTTDTTGRIGLTVGADGLEWVGRLAYADDNGVVVPVADLLTRRYVHQAEGTLFVVRGWLVDDSGVPRSCPVLSSPVPSGADAGCQHSWIAADRTLATGPPLDGALSVQPDAYLRYAPDPASASDSSPSSEPRLASYLLRLVSNEFGSDNYEVVARLDR